MYAKATLAGFHRPVTRVQEIDAGGPNRLVIEVETTSQTISHALVGRRKMLGVYCLIGLDCSTSDARCP